MFEIWFREADASNPEVMFFCSRCGCPAESHPVDTQWAQRERQRLAAEAANREGMRARARRTSVAAAEDAMAAHYRELGLKTGATLQEVRSCCRRRPLASVGCQLQAGLRKAIIP